MSVPVGVDMPTNAKKQIDLCSCYKDMPADRTLKTPLVMRKELFWEVDPKRVSTVLRENDNWAIVRIFEYGNTKDIFDAIEFYGHEKTTSVLSQEKLRPMARVMAYLFLNVDPENRYLKRQ